MSKGEEKKKLVKQWWFWVIIVSIIVVIASIITVVVVLTSRGSEKDTKKVVSDYTGSNAAATATIANATIEEDNTTTKTAKTTTVKKSNPTLGDTIEFDDFEITFGTEITFVTVDNRYSDYNGQEVIKLPVTIKNIGEETNRLNMFYYDLFGSKGTQLSSVSSYFDKAIDDMEKLRPQAVTDVNFYLLYDGNGTYGIDFDNYSEKITVEFNVEK